MLRSGLISYRDIKTSQLVRTNGVRNTYARSISVTLFSLVAPRLVLRQRGRFGVLY